MTDASLHDRMQMPRPEVSADEAAEILSAHYGLSGAIIELGSQQDRNYRIDTGDGRFVLKICHAEYELSELEAQNAAIKHLAAIADAPRVPTVMLSLDGQEILALTLGERDYRLRVLEYLEGEPLTRRKHLPLPSVSALGRICAQLALALADFEHRGLDRTLQWDLRKAGPVAVKLLAAIKDHQARDRIAKTMLMAVRRIQPLASSLRIQAVHHDVTDDNVVSRPDARGYPIPDGVIDFGDIIRGWLVGDLAVTCASLLHHAGGDPFYILPAIKAYHEVYPLAEPELKALWPLIVARAVILVASSEQQMAIDPANAYVLDNLEHEREIFDTATSVPLDLMESAILDSVGMQTINVVTKEWMPLFPDVDMQAIAFADLGVLSPHFSDGNWLIEDMDWRILARTAVATRFAATRYGEYRFSRSQPNLKTESETFALHVDICLPGATIVSAPFAGSIRREGGHLMVVGADICLHLDGVETSLDEGVAVAAGDMLGNVAGEDTAIGGLRVQLCRLEAIDPPLFCTPNRAAAWRSLCPSPAMLLGAGCDAPAPDGRAIFAKRLRHLARPQKNYYEAPPQIERGWKEHMFDVQGRAYLDMVNNVAIIGHGHPKLVAAVERQWSLLNTNSRFHYAAIAEFSERLADLAPDGLDTVFFVNSGSEANDVALRLAWAYTGARNMLCLLEGYHGWTIGSDAISTSIADNPRALSTRPDWVHAIAAPNTYRGQFRGPDSVGDYLDLVPPVLDGITEKGERLAGFICESVYGNAGGIPLPDGYLKQMYAMVRERGGVCIADEVQVGYGRLGHHFWGFEQQDAVPDIITIAKGMGNGHPLGAVITRKDIAEALEKEGYFFSSAGGSPVSCVVGMTVLDIMRDEALQDNARVVGDHLKARLTALIDRFPIVGAVHGMGLYLGLEFVRDREALEPATEETAAICDRLLELGVIMQPTGDHLNVLKIKPPLCLGMESADFFVDMLEKTLFEGW